MNSGAFDFVAKPSGAISLDLHKIKKELHEKVMAASRANIHELEKMREMLKEAHPFGENIVK